MMHELRRFKKNEDTADSTPKINLDIFGTYIRKLFKKKIARRHPTV